MDQIASWLATAATILAACLTASNLGSRITGYGFMVFTVGSIAWFTVGLLTDQPALIWTNMVMTVLNLFGVWRWLGRQARVEDGAQRATEKSEALATETLFPASMLNRAKLEDADGRDLGTLVDAMIGCRSGRLAYLVVAEGGVAGVGETLRRVEWSDASIDADRIAARFDESRFQSLPTVRKDDWPGQ